MGPEFPLVKPNFTVPGSVKAWIPVRLRSKVNAYILDANKGVHRLQFLCLEDHLAVDPDAVGPSMSRAMRTVSNVLTELLRPAC